jgi:hypothetical protein
MRRGGGSRARALFVKKTTGGIVAFLKGKTRPDAIGSVTRIKKMPFSAPFFQSEIKYRIQFNIFRDARVRKYYEVRSRPKFLLGRK